jgi:hypothetical protein
VSTTVPRSAAVNRGAVRRGKRCRPRLGGHARHADEEGDGVIPAAGGGEFEDLAVLEVQYQLGEQAITDRAGVVKFVVVRVFRVGTAWAPDSRGFRGGRRSDGPARAGSTAC